jgi:hypothetical protein
MANTAVITQTEWVDGASKYTRQNLNAKEQLALCIHAMSIELGAVGGTNYVTNGFESLIAASDAVSNYMNPDALCAAEVAIRYADAANAGGSVPATVDAKLLAAVKLLHYDEDRLRRAKLYLEGALGYHSSF